MKPKKPKQLKQKVEPIPKLKRRLLKLWSLVVRSRASFTCEICGARRGDIQASGKAVKIDAHHLVSRYIPSRLTYDPRNGVAVCVSCHKYGSESFHKNPLVALEKFKQLRSQDYMYLLSHASDREILSRSELECIEMDLEQALHDLQATIEAHI